MKKLLVLALVLSMATLANAGLVISTTTNGPLAEGETATIGISTDAIMGFGLGDWAGAALVLDTAKAGLSGGVSAQPLEPGIAVFQDAAAELSFIPNPAENGLGFMFLFTGANLAASSQLVSDIVYTAGSVAGPVTVTLWGSQDYVEYTNLGSIVINQVPEPFTMGLLGLGGLFLRRRK